MIRFHLIIRDRERYKYRQTDGYSEMETKEAAVGDSEFLTENKRS